MLYSCIFPPVTLAILSFPQSLTNTVVMKFFTFPNQIGKQCNFILLTLRVFPVMNEAKQSFTVKDHVHFVCVYGSSFHILCPLFTEQLVFYTDS